MTEYRHNMAEDSSLDLVSLRKLTEAVLDQAWSQLVETACNTFKELIAPITSTTGDVGRLISAKFDRLVDAEKVIAAQIMARAAEKASASNRQRNKFPKSSIILKIIESSSSETDLTLQELWTNLMANELVDSCIHPEFVRILTRLSASDVYRLIEIAQKSSPPKRVTIRFKILGLKFNLKENLDYPLSFINAHLCNIGLIQKRDLKVEKTNIVGSSFRVKDARYWELTVIGKAFIEAVNNPSLKAF
ncbi:Abi-alpha family protein [Nodularia sp. NIES-3585]|uniref:Abi-alpha family protein n=1 Tax=Nodularia sp. NIES-3585 TaxID=1973477 RepID=UPI000B5CF7BE|nr:Abi-alpha family protein [Nodularia sp. NIES-3585]GAX38214.1 hypothetical protein NIES3585_42620 [Nodularia sp. NIES-3585]